MDDPPFLNIDTTGAAQNEADNFVRNCVHLVCSPPCPFELRLHGAARVTGVLQLGMIGLLVGGVARLGGHLCQDRVGKRVR